MEFISLDIHRQRWTDLRGVRTKLSQPEWLRRACLALELLEQRVLLSKVVRGPAEVSLSSVLTRMCRVWVLGIESRLRI